MGLLIQVWTAGEPVPGALAARGRFFRMFEQALGAGKWGSRLQDGSLELINVEGVTARALPEIGSADGVIISGSPAFLREETPWIMRMLEHTGRLVEAQIPVLGVCFGHQILGEALGGRVEPNPRGREIGSAALRLSREDPLVFRPGEDQLEETVQMSHIDTIVSLPAGAEILAATAQEPHAAVRFAPLAWGVQFHPEMDAEVIHHYLQARKEAIVSEGLDFDALRSRVSEGSYGPRLLNRFVDLVEEARSPLTSSHRRR